jgi:hypothetical protein
VTIATLPWSSRACSRVGAASVLCVAPSAIKGLLSGDRAPAVAAPTRRPQPPLS